MECTEIPQQRRVKRERLVLEWDSGPRPEVKKKEKGKKVVAIVTPEVVGTVGNQSTSQRIASRRVETGV